MDAHPTAFGVLLKRFRGQTGLTQEALADRTGLSPQTITKLERGVHRAPRPETVHALAHALRLSPQERAHLERAALHRSVGVQSHHATEHTDDSAYAATVATILAALGTLRTHRPALVDVFVSTYPADDPGALDADWVRLTIL